MLMGPQIARARMDGGTLNIAVAIGKDLGLHTVTVRERVIGGDRACRCDPHDGAKVVAQILHLVLKPSVTERHQQITASIPDQPGTKVPACFRLGLLDEDDLDLVKAAVFPRQDRRPRATSVPTASGVPAL